MSFEENFVYPLYLILIGGGISGILIPTYNELVKRRQIEIEEIKHQKQIDIDRKREDHKNELEIKSDIVKKIAQIYAVVGFQIWDLAVEPGSKTKSTISESYEEWFKERETTTSLISAYFRESKIKKEWKSFVHNLAIIWTIFDRVALGEKISTDDLQNAKEYFKDRTDVNLEELSKGKNVIESYNKINDVLYKLKDDMIMKILDEKMNHDSN